MVTDKTIKTYIVILKRFLFVYTAIMILLPTIFKTYNGYNVI